MSTTGLAGFTLGGGSGWLERAFGFACDDLISVDLVTASGEPLTMRVWMPVFFRPYSKYSAP